MKTGVPHTQEGAHACPVTFTADVIGGKWKTLLIFHLMSGTRRFNELRRMIPEITQRMLTLQLRELESWGLVNRHVYQEVPPKVEYSLTEVGSTLIPLVSAMREWGSQYEDILIKIKANAAANE